MIEITWWGYGIYILMQLEFYPTAEVDPVNIQRPTAIWIEIRRPVSRGDFDPTVQNPNARGGSILLRTLTMGLASLELLFLIFDPRNKRDNKLHGGQGT